MSLRKTVVSLGVSKINSSVALRTLDSSQARQCLHLSEAWQSYQQSANKRIDIGLYFNYYQVGPITSIEYIWIIPWNKKNRQRRLPYFSCVDCGVYEEVRRELKVPFKCLSRRLFSLKIVPRLRRSRVPSHHRFIPSLPSLVSLSPSRRAVMCLLCEITRP